MPSAAPPAVPPKDGKHSRISTAASGKSSVADVPPKPAVEKFAHRAETAPPEDHPSNHESVSKKTQKGKPGPFLGNKAKAAPVQVCVRIRPITPAEALKQGKDLCAEAIKTSNQIRIRSSKEKPRDFSFDAVFDLNDSQTQVYERMIKDLIVRCLEGYNGCIFAYGQTASGKTYTMQGPSIQPSPEQFGILQRSALQIMKHIDEHTDKNLSFTVKVSYFEIYNEKIIDLLAPRDDQTDLKIRQETDGTGLYIQGITEKTVGTLQDIMNAHSSGSKNRTVAETSMNEASSRSHAIMSITVVEQRIDTRADKALKQSSKIHIVDLAGSERADSTGATGARLKEGSAINQSLSALGNVINALTRPAKDRGHIPYRDSKLTYLLSDSLGGNSLTLMIACLSPTVANYDESVSTLRFAERVKSIKNQAKINMDPLMLRILELEEEVEALKRRLRLCVCGIGLDGDLDDVSSCSTLSRQTKKLFFNIKNSFGRKRVVPKEDLPDEPKDKSAIKATSEID